MDFGFPKHLLSPLDLHFRGGGDPLHPAQRRTDHRWANYRAPWAAKDVCSVSIWFSPSWLEPDVSLMDDLGLEVAIFWIYLNWHWTCYQRHDMASLMMMMMMTTTTTTTIRMRMRADNDNAADYDVAIVHLMLHATVPLGLRLQFWSDLIRFFAVRCGNSICC